MFVCVKKAKKEEAGQSGGEEEPEEESHTLLPPPMQIIKDPNNPEVKTLNHPAGTWETKRTEDLLSSQTDFTHQHSDSRQKIM